MSTRERNQPVEALLSYDERGLVPCVVQDWATGEVLTLAYMNELALERTRATGELHLHSRSRDELWHKGATSGNTQTVRALRVDCDELDCQVHLDLSVRVRRDWRADDGLLDRLGIN